MKKRKLNSEKPAVAAVSVLGRFSCLVALAFFAGMGFSFIVPGNPEALGGPKLYTEKECLRMIDHECHARYAQCQNEEEEICDEKADETRQEGYEEGYEKGYRKGYKRGCWGL